MDYNDLKTGDIIRIKGMLGIDCIGIFNKIEDDIIYLYCTHYADMNNICYVKDGKYCSIHINNINACLLATEYEIIEFYNKIIISYKEYDKSYLNYLTDSIYYEIMDWFGYNCGVQNEEPYPKFVRDFTQYTWSYLMNEIGYEELNEDKMVSIDKVCNYLENINTDNYMDSGIFQMYDLIKDLRKKLEE